MSRRTKYDRLLDGLAWMIVAGVVSVPVGLIVREHGWFAALQGSAIMLGIFGAIFAFIWASLRLLTRL